MYKLKYKTPDESIITKECDSYFESRRYEMNNSDKISEVLSLFAVFKMVQHYQYHLMQELQELI